MGKQPLIEEIYDKTKTLTGSKRIKSKSVYDLLIELNSINEIIDLTKLKNKYQGELLNGVNFEISIKKNSSFYDLNLKLS
jgi:hypothetical protein